MDVSESTVRNAARSVGVELSDNEISEFATDAEEALDMLSELSPTDHEGEPVTDRRLGEDKYNAFRYRFEKGSGRGPLEDLSIAVKDNMAVAGIPMTCGSAAVDFEPSYDATAVRRLTESGANLIGTTNMDEFALSTTGETCAHGRTLNPVVDSGVPGGSSSGSGAAVAAGLVDAALGSDTGGSIRIPASFCGIVGLKPTHRSVSRFGVADLAPSLDHVGPLAKDVETTFRVYDAISGPDVNDLSSHPTRPAANTAGAVTEAPGAPTIGVVDEAMALADDDIVRTVDAALEELSEAGASITSVSFPEWEMLPAAVVIIANVEFASLFENYGLVRSSGTGYVDGWRQAAAGIDDSRIGEGALESLVTFQTLFEATEGKVYVAAQNVRRTFIERVCVALDEVDILACPTTPMTAPSFGEVETVEDVMATIANTSPFDLTGHPALSVPCGSEGRPVGLQLVADWYDESALARVGAAMEAY